MVEGAREFSGAIVFGGQDFTLWILGGHRLSSHFPLFMAELMYRNSVVCAFLVDTSRVIHYKLFVSIFMASDIPSEACLGVHLTVSLMWDLGRFQLFVL